MSSLLVETVRVCNTLLCDDCNNLIGRAGENPDVLRAAAEYLERWS